MSAVAEREKLLTRAEAAEFLGMKEQTLAAWAMTARHVPFVRVGSRSIRYRLGDLHRFVEKQTVGAAE